MPSAFDPQATADLHRRLNDLTPDAQRQWGRMTAHQAVVHMTDAFSMAFGELDIGDRSTVLLRTLGRWIAFHTPLRWPKGFPSARQMDQERDGTPPTTWDDDLAALHDALDRFVADPDRLAGNLHPAFGPITRREWGIWGWRHMDHHLRQFGA